MMKNNLAAAVVMGMGLVFSTSVLAADTEEKVGDWQIVTRSQPDKSPNPICIIRSPKVAGSPQLQFTNPVYVKPPATTKGNAQLFLYVDRLISTEKSVKLPDAVFSLGGDKTWTVEATWTKLSDTGGTITAMLDPEIETIVKPFASANALEVSFKGPDGSDQNFSIDLKGSSRAMDAYKKCLSTVQLN